MLLLEVKLLLWWLSSFIHSFIHSFTELSSSEKSNIVAQNNDIMYEAEAIFIRRHSKGLIYEE